MFRFLLFLINIPKIIEQRFSNVTIGLNMSWCIRFSDNPLIFFIRLIKRSFNKIIYKYALLLSD